MLCASSLAKNVSSTYGKRRGIPWSERQKNRADIFTKPLPPSYFHDLIFKLKLVSLHPTWVWEGLWEYDPGKLRPNISSYRVLILLV